MMWGVQAVPTLERSPQPTFPAPPWHRLRSAGRLNGSVLWPAEGRLTCGRRRRKRRGRRDV